LKRVWPAPAQHKTEPAPAQQFIISWLFSFCCRTWIAHILHANETNRKTEQRKREDYLGWRSVFVVVGGDLRWRRWWRSCFSSSSPCRGDNPCIFSFSYSFCFPSLLSISILHLSFSLSLFLFFPLFFSCSLSLSSSIFFFSLLFCSSSAASSFVLSLPMYL